MVGDVKRLIVLVALAVGLIGGQAKAAYEPPTVPYSGCISGTYMDEQGHVVDFGVSCSIMIPMVAAD